MSLPKSPPFDRATSRIFTVYSLTEVKDGVSKTYQYGVYRQDAQGAERRVQWSMGDYDIFAKVHTDLTHPVANTLCRRLSTTLTFDTQEMRDERKAQRRLDLIANGRDPYRWEKRKLARGMVRRVKATFTEDAR